MQIKKIIILVIIGLLVFSCSNSSDELFEQIISSQPKEQEILVPIDMHTSSGNKYYDKIYTQGKRHNKFLLEKAYSEKITNYYIPNISRLTEGDIAIMLLMDINFKGTDNEWKKIFINDKMIEDYNRNGARVWWDWIQAKKENRAWIILQIKRKLL